MNYPVMGMETPKKIVVFGTGLFAEVVHEYLENDPRYKIAAFTADSDYVGGDEKFLGKPLIPFEEVDTHYPPEEHLMFIAIGYSRVNRVRKKKFLEAKRKGYKLLTYVSPHAFLWRTVKLGENVFVFENNVVQPFVEIGDNTILWSGNHIGHHTKIGSHVFISSHVVISGNCRVGDHTFMGVNSTVIEGIKIAHDNIIGASTLIIEDTEPGGVYVGMPAKKIRTVYEHELRPEK